jgi:metallo-beta-lactamase family protein
VRARVDTLDSLSAHADRGEILKWIRSGRHRPGRVHLVHGEPAAAAALAEKMRVEEKLDVAVPDYLDRIRI